MKKMNKKGFTIVELVVVIAVIAILAAVMIPTFGGIVDKANASKALQEAKNAYTKYLIAHYDAESEVKYVKVVDEDGEETYYSVEEFALLEDVPADATGAKVWTVGECAYSCADECEECEGEGTVAHDYVEGECTECNTVCDHGETATGAVCTVCGDTKE